MNRNENFHISNLIKFPISESNEIFSLFKKKKRMIDAIHAIIVDK